MTRGRSSRINHHSLVFWLFPLLLVALILGLYLYLQPRLNDLVQHALLLLHFLFI